MMKKYMFAFMTFLLTMVLVACGNDEEQSEDAMQPELEITEEEKVAEDEVVAVVNGEEVTGDIYNIVYSQLKLYSVQFGQEVDEEEMKELTMESVIDRQLLFQEASEEGIEITDEEATAEIETIKEENPDVLETLLGQFQLTEEGFKEQLKFELTMYEYMDQIIEVTVTDEEVEEAYEQAITESETDEEVPEFDEVENNIRTQMTQQKTEEAFQAKIDEVRSTSEIDKKI